jgi:tRNA (uracil-5-)-methyltransferase TRM9
MPATIQARLLDLNRQFYATVAGEFDLTRHGLPTGMVDLAGRLAARKHAGGKDTLRVLDVGCGNGRFARALAQVGQAAEYLGVDADDRLLAAAAAQTTSLPQVNTRLVQVDIAQPNWPEQLGSDEPFDAVVCLAVLHHFPGLALRQRIVADLAHLLAVHGILAMSTWQFLTSERLAAKQIEWTELGIDPANVEPGDALLPWNQGSYAVRYVHQLELDEVETLAGGAGLRVTDTFRADGKEGNLNLYTLLQV